MKNTIIRILLSLLTIVLVYIAVVLVHGTLTDYQPEAILPIDVEQSAESELITDSVLTFTIWNIGYGGLGAEADFFFDDGGFLFAGDNMVRPPRDLVEKYVNGATDFVQNTQSDFFLFQEVDVESKRSYFINQFEAIREALPDYAATFAPNYNAPRVPLPLLEPWRAYGKAYSGLGTFAKYQPVEAKRYQLPGSFAWPTRIFQLDRCVGLHRFKVDNGKELVVLNIHNSAHDSDGSLKRQEMAFIKDLVMQEYEKGNYVIAGGDWNECPPYFQYDGFMPGQGGDYFQYNIEPDFLPEDWQWVYDPTVPTNRKVADPLVMGETFMTLIDFFLISPNVRVLAVKGINQQFRYSDHQPVWMEVELVGN
jgi:endonuclease/exonuclease/phosphatase family metal-dependent hydrolase